MSDLPSSTEFSNNCLLCQIRLLAAVLNVSVLNNMYFFSLNLEGIVCLWVQLHHKSR